MSADLPEDLRAVLPADTARAWSVLRDLLPATMVLYGGTAVAVHLRHRVSRDLDFFFDDPTIDLKTLRARLEAIRPTAVAHQDAATLNTLVGRTQVRFLSMAGQQQPVTEPTEAAGIPVAGLRDLAATKVKVIGDRGELRDYYDLMTIEKQTAITAEAALLDYQARYQTYDQGSLTHLVRALGYLGDVADDPGLPAERGEIESYWHERQHDLYTALDPTGFVPHEPVPPSHLSASAAAQTRADSHADHGAGQAGEGEMVWVAAHVRNGRRVRGHWRRR